MDFYYITVNRAELLKSGKSNTESILLFNMPSVISFASYPFIEIFFFLTFDAVQGHLFELSP